MKFADIRKKIPNFLSQFHFTSNNNFLSLKGCHQHSCYITQLVDNFLQTRRRGILRQGLSSLLDPSTQVLVDAVEHLVRLLADLLMGIAQVSRHVLDEVLLLARLATKHVPEGVGLHKVLVGDRELRGNNRADPFLMLLACLDRAVREGSEAGRVVRVRAIVAVHIHRAVTLEGVERLQRAVDGDLLVVDTQAVAVGVWVREETRLQDRVGRRLDTRDHVRGRERHLLDLSEVVLRVLVQSDLAKAAQRHLSLRPDLGQVEDVPAELLRLLRAENLDVAGPRWVLASLDGVEQVLRVPVRVGPCQLDRLFVREGLVALVGLHVDLDVVKTAIGLDPLVRVA